MEAGDYQQRVALHREKQHVGKTPQEGAAQVLVNHREF